MFKNTINKTDGDVGRSLDSTTEHQILQYRANAEWRNVQQLNAVLLQYQTPEYQIVRA
jgi:hypothetical protein